MPHQDPTSKSTQLYKIPVTAFSYTDLFLDRISLEWDTRESAMIDHKKIIDVTASLNRNYFSFTKAKMTSDRSVSKNAVT